MMSKGDLVRFKEPDLRTEGEIGIVIDDAPETPWRPTGYVEVFWPTGSQILEDKGMLEVISEVRRSS